MKILNGYSKIKKNNTVLTIGNFDGVHRGHQKIIKQTVKLSKKKNLKSVVITFKPHPSVFLKKNYKPFKLTSEETKIEEIKKLGIDYLTFLKFDKNFNKLSPESFVKKVKPDLKESEKRADKIVAVTGAVYDKEDSILKEILTDLYSQRKEYKRKSFELQQKAYEMEKQEAT